MSDQDKTSDEANRLRDRMERLRIIRRLVLDERARAVIGDSIAELERQIKDLEEHD